MKFKIKKNILLENLNYVSKAISNRNIIPVLNGIKFNLTKDGLYLETTDNDLSIKTFINKVDINSIDEEGSLIINSKFIIDIIRKLPSDIINIEDLDNSKAVIYTENAKYNLNCFDLEDWPNIDFSESKNNFKIDANIFKKIINETSFATSTQESRPLLTGINLKINGNILEVIATDSYRLAKRMYNFSNNELSNINIVIPAKNINELVKIIEDEEEILELHIFGNKLLFKYKNILFQSSLLNGTYPNTDNLIPSIFDITVEANLNDFYNVIDRASILTQSKDKNIIQMELNNNQIIVTSSSSEIGRVEEKMECINVNSSNLIISFSAKYMLEALKIFNCENIKILLNGDIKPIIIKNSENDDLVQLILPIKTY